MGTLPDKSLESFKDDPIDPFRGSTSEIEPPPPEARAADGLVVVMHKIERRRLLFGDIVATLTLSEMTISYVGSMEFSSQDTESTLLHTGCRVTPMRNPLVTFTTLQRTR